MASDTVADAPATRPPEGDSQRSTRLAKAGEFDAIVVADGAPQDGDFRALVLLQEAYRHLKAVGAWGTGVDVLRAAGIDPEAPGVLTGKKANAKLATATVARSAAVGVAAGVAGWLITVLVGEAATGQVNAALTSSVLWLPYLTFAACCTAIVLYTTRIPRGTS